MNINVPEWQRLGEQQWMHEMLLSERLFSIISRWIRIRTIHYGNRTEMAVLWPALELMRMGRRRVNWEGKM